MSLSGVIEGFWAGTFARNSEVLQNELSENDDPIGHWMLASGGVDGSGGEPKYCSLGVDGAGW